eukprot:scaffold129880_cov21-Tisochrysis_lutea.AAC.1
MNGRGASAAVRWQHTPGTRQQTTHNLHAMDGKDWQIPPNGPRLQIPTWKTCWASCCNEA